MLWAQSTTKNYIRAEHKLQSISKLFIPQVIIPQVGLFFVFRFVFSRSTAQILSTISESKTRKNNYTSFGACLYSMSTQRRNLHQAGWLILLCGPTQEPVLATANTGKTRERFMKKCRWMDRKVEIRKKFMAVSTACMAIYWPSPGFRGRTFKLCVLSRRDFKFCVRSSPPWGLRRGKSEVK